MSQEPPINSVITSNNNIIISQQQSQIQNLTTATAVTTTIPLSSSHLGVVGIGGAGGGGGTATIINHPLTTSSPTARVVVSGGPGIGGNVKTNNMQVVKSQDVRVDNWGNYCLQRLQVMYDRGDFCDLILQFHTNQILKVHRVVVNLCTEYFANLERNYGLTGGMLVLPKDIEYSTMVTIVKFFYTGKLEVKGAQFNDIYRTVKLMNILILTKLLEAHARKPIALAKKEPNRPIVFKQAVEIGRPLQKVPVQHTHSAVQQGSTIRLSSPSSTVTTKTLSRPFPPGVKTKTVLARVQPQTIRVTGQQIQGKLSAPKKLPIWKERKFAPAANSDPLMMEKWPPRDEPPRPTRFEWPDPDDHDDPYVTPATHALMDRQKAAASNRKVEDIFDAVKNQTHGVKRSLPTYSTQLGSASKGAIGDANNIGSPIRADSDGSPASKVAKVLDNTTTVPIPSSAPDSVENVSLNSTDMTENSAESSSMSMSDVNLTDETVEEVVSTSEGSYNQDCLDSTQLSDTTASGDTTLLTTDASISFDSSSISTTNEISSPTPSTSRNISNVNLTAKRSSIKVTTSSNLNISSPGLQRVEKTVRFAPEIEKENSKSKDLVVVSLGGISHATTSITTSSASPIVVSKNPESASSSNHSKIISEVLKKYPDLVKDNKNIKLKIVQKESDLPSATSPTKDSKSKVSYIVLKSTSAPDGGGSVVLKKPSSTNKSFWDSDKTPKKVPSGAENTTGPWLCISCGTDEIPIEFETYYNYRRHLVDIHGERIDARICEYCGQKASKRNLLLYHLYTKHGVTPPKNCVFPHCDRCDYVALSESLLTKHKQGHDVNKEYSCTICNASFKSNAALQGHMAANLHRNKDTKVYECPYCRKPFVRNINLKAHIRSLHKDVARLEEMEDPRLPPDDSLSSRAVTIVHSGGVKKRQFPSILGAARLQSGATIIESPEDISAAHAMDGLVRSFVTADGQTIEILQGIDPNSMSVPVLVPTSEGTLGLAEHHGHVSVGATEFVTGMNSDGTQAVFMLDGSQNAVEVDMSQVGVGVGVPVGVGMTADGSMIFEGGDPTGGSDQFIVQDMQGNQFRKITGIDETGKQVIFFQLQDENGQVTMTPAILDDSVSVRYDEGQGGGAVSGVATDGSAHFDFESGQATFSVQNDHMYLDPQKCSVFVSSGGVTLPVTVASDASMSGQAAQVLLSNLGASVQPGHVIEFHAASSGVSESHASHDPNSVTTVTAESLMNQGHVQLVSSDHHHHHLLQGQHQLHIVLDENQVGVVDSGAGKGNMIEAEPNHVQQMQNEEQELAVDQQQGHLNVQHKLQVINQVMERVQVQVSEALKNVKSEAVQEQVHEEQQVEIQEQSEEGHPEQQQQLLENSETVNLEEELLEQQEQDVSEEDKHEKEMQINPPQAETETLEENLNIGILSESDETSEIAVTECETEAIPAECPVDDNNENVEEEHVVGENDPENENQIEASSNQQIEYQVEESECMEIVEESQTGNEQVELQECTETEEMDVVQEVQDEDVLHEGDVNTEVSINMEEEVVVQDEEHGEQEEHLQLLVEEHTIVEMDPQESDDGMVHHEIAHVEEQEVGHSDQVQIEEEVEETEHEASLSIENEIEEAQRHDSPEDQVDEVTLQIHETPELLTEEVETQIIQVEEGEQFEQDHEQVIIDESEHPQEVEEEGDVDNLVEISSTDADTQELMVEDAVVDVM